MQEDNNAASAAHDGVAAGAPLFSCHETREGAETAQFFSELRGQDNLKSYEAQVGMEVDAKIKYVAVVDQVPRDVYDVTGHATSAGTNPGGAIEVVLPAPSNPEKPVMGTARS